MRRRSVNVLMVLCIVWGGIICWLSLTPSPPEISSPVLGWDKAQHAAAYAVFAYLSLCAFVPKGRARGATLKVVLIIVLYGVLMELAQQQLTPNRTADILDFIANTVGAVSASVLYRLPALFSRCREEEQ